MTDDHTKHIFIFRVRQDGHVEVPNAWRICRNDGDVVIHREPGESDEHLRARTIEAAGPTTQIILHTNETKAL